ncbi:type VII secretion integral membrane protein EccD [Streptomyces mirabilis]|uniref:type VII secretion integral membrane protein EccD n=1 Tax=Streptomyces mirabilis TaxID=68239 RepID=UPI00369B2B10
MNEGFTVDLCRLTIRAPDRVIDLAVPSDIPLADLLPVIVEHAGEDLEEAGLDHEGWILQRVGGTPLDGEVTAAALGLPDGEQLVLRPRTTALPAVRFDNLVDAVSSTVRGLPHGWSPEISKWALRAMFGAALAGCLGLLAAPGAIGSRLLLTAGAVVLALAGAGAAARSVGDRPSGVLLGVAASAFLALSGALVVGDPWIVPRTHGQAGAELLAAGVAGVVGSMAGFGVVSVAAVVFAAAAVIWFAAALSGLIMMIFGLPVSAAAAGVALAAVVFGAFVPMLSFSLSGLKLPPLPTNAEQLQEGIEPHSGEDIDLRSAATEQWMNGLYLALGVVCVGCVAAMLTDAGLPQLVTGVLLSLLMALHGRNLGSAWQRLGMQVPAVLGVLLIILVSAGQGSPFTRLIASVGCLGLGALFVALSWTVPGRRLLPHWARAGDLLQSVVAVGLVPAVLWVSGLYQYLRSVKG